MHNARHNSENLGSRSCTVLLNAQVVAWLAAKTETKLVSRSAHCSRKKNQQQKMYEFFFIPQVLSHYGLFTKGSPA